MHVASHRTRVLDGFDWCKKHATESVQFTSSFTSFPFGGNAGPAPCGKGGLRRVVPPPSVTVNCNTSHLWSDLQFWHLLQVVNLTVPQRYSCWYFHFLFFSPEHFKDVSLTIFCHTILILERYFLCGLFFFFFKFYSLIDHIYVVLNLIFSFKFYKSCMFTKAPFFHMKVNTQHNTTIPEAKKKKKVD